MTSAIYSHTFDNGLVLIAEPMEWLESAAFSLLVPSGSAYDPTDRAGLAELTCEMSLRGAGERDSRRFVTDLDNLGVERGDSVSSSHSSYSGATLARNIDAALAIYADVLRRPLFPSDQLDAARQGVLQELHAIEDEPGQKLMVELRRRHYPRPWGLPSLGDEAGVTATTIADVRGQAQRLRRPNGAIVAVAGRIDWPRLKDHVGQLLADWRPVPEPVIHESAAGPRRDHIPHESNQTQIGIAFDSVPYRHPDYFQAWGAVGILSGGMSSRLFTEVREKRGLCYSVNASHHTLLDRGCVVCCAGTSAERAQETLDVTLHELRRLTDGVEQRELDRLKARIKSLLIMQQESSASRSSSLARDWYHLGRVRPLAELERIIDELSCDSINAFLAANPPREFTIVTLGPAPLEVPDGVS